MDTVYILNPDTGELQPLPPGRAAEVTQQQERLTAAIADEAHRVTRWTRRFDAITDVPKKVLLAAALVGALGLGSVLGGVGNSWLERSTSNAQIAMAMRTAIPVVRALDIDVDPGKYDGKLLDVVMEITKGGVYKSGKALYLQERDQGFSLVIFKSAFAGFGEDMETHPDRIVAQYIGKYVKARGTVRRFATQKDGEARMSMIVYAPGLLSEIPTR